MTSPARANLAKAIAYRNEQHARLNRIEAAEFPADFAFCETRRAYAKAQAAATDASRAARGHRCAEPSLAVLQARKERDRARRAADAAATVHARLEQQRPHAERDLDYSRRALHEAVLGVIRDETRGSLSDTEILDVAEAELAMLMQESPGLLMKAAFPPYGLPRRLPQSAPIDGGERYYRNLAMVAVYKLAVDCPARPAEAWAEAVQALQRDPTAPLPEPEPEEGGGYAYDFACTDAPVSPK